MVHLDCGVIYFVRHDELTEGREPFVYALTARTTVRDEQLRDVVASPTVHEELATNESRVKKYSEGVCHRHRPEVLQCRSAIVECA